MKKLLVIAAAILAPSLALAGEPGVNQWGVSTAKDPITDDVRVNAATVSSNGLGLLFQCSQDQFGAVLIPNTPSLSMEFITTDRTVPVAWRVDDKPAVNESWNVLRGKAGSPYVVITVDAREFAQAVVAGKERVVVRVHGITETMPLDGAEASVSEAMEACE